MEYFCCVLHKIYNILTDPTIIGEYVEIVVNLITGVVLISGIRYLKPLKEKTVSSTFNFWAQLKIYLSQIVLYIDSDVGVLDNLYSEESRKDWDILSPADLRVKEFKNIVESTIHFLKSSPDQMPAYKGWSDDYSELIQFLNDIIVFDICDKSQYFKFSEKKSVKERNEFGENICRLINKVCEGIVKKQNKVETDIFQSDFWG